MLSLNYPGFSLTWYFDVLVRVNIDPLYHTPTPSGIRHREFRVRKCRQKEEIRKTNWCLLQEVSVFQSGV